jgi:hypothetical protein
VACAVAWPVAALLLPRLPPRERERLAVDVGICYKYLIISCQ